MAYCMTYCNKRVKEFCDTDPFFWGFWLLCGGRRTMCVAVVV